MSKESSPRSEIFVVDDDPAVRETLSAILRGNGYEVACFAEARSFLAAACAREPTCILLDVHLPGQSGLDILKDLNAEEYAVPILIVSGTGDIPMAVEAIKHGALRILNCYPCGGRRPNARFQMPLASARVSMCGVS